MNTHHLYSNVNQDSSPKIGLSPLLVLGPCANQGRDEYEDEDTASESCCSVSGSELDDSDFSGEEDDQAEGYEFYGEGLEAGKSVLDFFAVREDSGAEADSDDDCGQEMLSFSRSYGAGFKDALGSSSPTG